MGGGCVAALPVSDQHQPPSAEIKIAWAWRVLVAGVAASAAVGVLFSIADAHGLGARFTVAALTAVNIVILGGCAAFGVGASTRSRARQRTAERETAATYSQLQALIDNTSAVIYMKRIDDGVYLMVNREWERLFKASRARVLDMTDHEVFPPAVAEALRSNDLRVAAVGRTVHFEETADTDDGPHTYISVKFPVHNSEGVAYAVCGISTDITDRKRAEEEVRRLNDALEARVLERTAELEASTRELDSFAYSVSHDLRAPLRSLHGFSQALLEDYGDVLDDTGKDYLGRLQKNVRRMGDMIDNLLTLSRATRVELSRHPVDLSALATELVAELRANDPGRNVSVTIADDLTCVGDAQLLRLVLQNLLANAWKFTSKQSAPAIEVGQETQGPECLFFVRDNGAGFDMRYAEKLFGAFQRLHSASDFEGTGIGLATVQRIINRHGGRIFAEAEPGHGATFYFTTQPPSRTSRALQGAMAAMRTPVQRAQERTPVRTPGGDEG